MLTADGTTAVTSGQRSLTSLARRASTLGYPWGEEVGGPLKTEGLINKLNTNGKRPMVRVLLGQTQTEEMALTEL